ncbi:MAG: ATP-dependent RNA helicase HrpA [Pseudomonadales bacterium]|nr:ATP-dependent RNA helicase HrpA [Pseudomonadales bacterium]
MKLNEVRSLPPVTLTPGLPITEKAEQIVSLITDNQVVIIAGETGSGKTTQIPKICVQCGFGAKGLIGHTQPRRLAARSVASRIAEELNQELGKGVGYQVRFNDKTEAGTFIKLMTDGILLAEIQQDPLLRNYEVLIIDEAHERSLNIDFLLGYLRQLLKRRADLKLVITSATIDVEKFSHHFATAPVIQVSGRSYPVEIRYRPPAGEPGSTEDPVAEQVVKTLAELAQEERRLRKSMGDVLIFLSGEKEIRDLAQTLRNQNYSHTEILPLYARLSQGEQKRIFSKHQGRRIILATNVAETSLTVPGVMYVIDTGLARISRYSIQSKVQRLPIEKISRASANQRAGRCGRIAKGICIRLYSEEDFNNRVEFTEPEIQRTNLSAVILQMLSLRLGNIADFPFIDPPERRAINDGFALLLELGAIDSQKSLSAVGRKMCRIPVDPRLARILVEAGTNGSLRELLIIVSALATQDPREFPAEKRQAAREFHQQYAHPDSDFMSWIKLWEVYEQQRQNLTQKQLRDYCSKHYLSFMRMREWREIHRQLTLACQQLGLRVNTEAANYETIHRAILSGSQSQIAQKGQDGLFTACRGRKLALSPASALARRSPRWIVCAELIETDRLFAATVARIEPEWVVDVSTHLVKREHFEAHWEKKRGQVVAFERISLYGLTLIERKPVNFRNIDLLISREIFIREALLGMQLDTRASFYQKNKAMIAEIKREEEKLRRTDILISDEKIYQFYDERIPTDMADARHFEQWCLGMEKKEPGFLCMSREFLSNHESAETLHVDFPDYTKLANNKLAIDYRFTPGSSDDGACVTIPVSMLNLLNEKELDWAIPGQVKSRCEAYIKAFPKALRKQFMPINLFVEKALAHAEPGSESLITLLRQQAARQKIHIDVETWLEISSKTAVLPRHLRTSLRLVNNKGHELARDDSLANLRKQYGHLADAGLAQTRQVHQIEQKGLKTWSFDPLPDTVTVGKEVKLIRYPGLLDEGKSVAIRLFESREQALAAGRLGVARLLILRTKQQADTVVNQFARLQKELLLKLPSGQQLFMENALMAVYLQCFDLRAALPKTQDEFELRLSRGKADILVTGDRLSGILRQVFELLFQLKHRLKQQEKNQLNASLNDINQQVELLFAADFIVSTPWVWLQQYPRYLKAITLRIEKMIHDSEKDQLFVQQLNSLQQEYEQLLSLSREKVLVELEDFPWCLQELRVSLFAQALKTRFPVSVTRLEKKLAAIKA